MITGLAVTMRPRDEKERIRHQRPLERLKMPYGSKAMYLPHIKGLCLRYLNENRSQHSHQFHSVSISVTTGAWTKTFENIPDLKFSNHDVKILKPATYLDPWVFVDHSFSKKLFGSCISLVPWHRFVRSKMNYSN